MSASNPPVRERILDAAFNAFMRFGYQGVSTAQIARIAHVSKRDLYALFGSKQAMLAVCVAERADRMREPLTLSSPSGAPGLTQTGLTQTGLTETGLTETGLTQTGLTRTGLTQTLVEFGVVVVREVTRPEVVATFRLAILEAENAPDVAVTLDRHGRQANVQALTGLLTAARDQRLLDGAEPIQMAEMFLGMLLRGGILVRMLMGIASAPDEAEQRHRAETAAAGLMRLYGVRD
jgi:AcrR family transcriptional regulator